MKAKSLLVPVLLACSLGAVAQPGGGMGMQPMLQRLEQRLGLTPAQKPKVEAILREQREKMRALRQETRQRLKRVLTAEQWEKFQAMHRQRMDRWRRAGPR